MIHISKDDQIIENQVFTGNASALDLHEDGRKRGTFRSYSVLVDGNRIHFKHCVFENTAGPGKSAGQAIALYLDGDDIVLSDCVIKGHQDTLFLAPLPEKEIIPGGFLGPKQFEKRIHRTFRFERCRIEGGVDFIFGGGTAYFHDCVFVSVEHGYVFAPSTPEDEAVGFVAENCCFTHTSNVNKHSCYLARPWRNHAKVTLKHCFMEDHIHPQGWDDWNKPDAHATVQFIELDSFGPGAQGKRPDYVKTDQ